MKLGMIGALVGALFATSAMAEQARITAVGPSPSASLPASVSGRVVRDAADRYQYQWPGVYFEAAFEGKNLYFNVGPGDVILRVLVDSVETATMVKPAAGLYLIDGLAAGAHTVRIEVATESQAGPNTFGGFVLPAGTKALPVPRRARQFEFIGDSHTVGYGNTSTSRDCTNEQVWATTDNTKSVGALTARYYGADYRIHAISGRGIVRNFGGSQGDPLPVAYPHTLFDKGARDAAPDWKPQLIVISLGTNDFSTALNPGEKWKTRDALHADYESTYVELILGLRAKNPQAHFVLWVLDGATGEIYSEVQKVVARLKAAGEDRVSFVPLSGMEMTGCHWHPSAGDDKTISDALIKHIETIPALRGSAAPVK
jgi:lysophospholipase L1-like esterase